MSISGNKFAREWMGKVVKVSAVMDRRPEDSGPWMERPIVPRACPVPVVGWVVGYRYMRRGRVDTDWDDGRPTFTVTQDDTLAILVCPWPGRKPILADPGGIVLTDEQPIPPEWTARARGEMAEEMRDRRRDDKGRWLPLSGWGSKCS